MDTDPLADTAPPRYAVESDEEEDEGNPLGSTNDAVSTKVDVKIVGDLHTEVPLVIATGDAGKYWAKGADLGEQTAGVYANKIQVGLVMNPSWTKATVIISEALSRLPVWAMNTYAKSIIDTLKPTSVVILDSYPVPTYVTDAPTSYEDAPLRYLASSVEDPFSGEASPFAPPNLLQTTSASFLSILSSTGTEASALLLPSPHTAPPAPKTIEPTDFSKLDQNTVHWSASTMKSTQHLLFKAIGEDVDPQWEIDDDDNEPGETVQKKSSGVGEGGMYI